MQSILRISEAASIALHAMIYISLHTENSVSSKEIARNFDISEHHLSKVLKRLVEADLLKSVKGPHGGFSLAKEADEVSYLEIYEAIDGPIKEGCCLFGRQVCSNAECIMGDFLNSTNKSVKEFFGTRKLSDFWDEKKQ